MMKTSLLSRLKMQREDAAHAVVMGACHSLLARSKEMTGMMEQARRKLVSASHLFSITHNIYQVASIGMTSSAQILNRLASRDAHIESDLRSKLKSPQSQSQSQLSFVDQSSARAPSRFELLQAALRTPSSLSSSSSADGSNFFSSGTNTSTSSLSGLAAAASAAAPTPPAALLGKPPLVRDADQAPASLQRTAASILRAASASHVRHPPHTLLLPCLVLPHFSRNSRNNTPTLRCRLCRQCCADARWSCRTPWKRRPTRSMPVRL